MGALGLEGLSQFSQDYAELLEVHLSPVGIEDLDEAAHVGPLVVVGQIDVHVDAGHGLLGAVPLVADGDRVADVLDPHLVDLDVAVVFQALDVDHETESRSN